MNYLIALLVVVLLALGTCQVSATNYTIVTILHTNDMHGRVMPDNEPGGLGRAATLIRQIRAEAPNVLLLDAGDIIHGTPEDYLSAGMASITAMNSIGYSAATTGNHEYDFGLDTLRGVESAASFPLLAANIRAADGGQWDRIAPYSIVELGGLRIAVVGLATLDTISLHWPNAIREISVEDPFAATREIIPEVRKQADVVVVLSHLGAAQDALLAAGVPGIDFIVGGHSHTAITDWRWVGDTLIVQAGAYARALGRIDFIVRSDETGSEIVSVNGKGQRWNDLPRPPLGLKYPDAPLTVIDETIPYDPEVARAYLPYKEQAAARLAEVLGQAPEGVAGRTAGADESAAGDLVADAVREFARSDVAVIDANSLAAGGLAAGPVTLKSVFDLIGGYTRQHIVVCRLTGRELQAGIDARLSEKRAVTYAVSGAAFDFAVADGVPQVTRLTIGGKPVEPDRAYTVAAQAYVMMELMGSAPSAVVVAEPATTTREALADYVRARRTLVPPATDRIRRLIAAETAR